MAAQEEGRKPAWLEEYEARRAEANDDTAAEPARASDGAETDAVPEPPFAVDPLDEILSDDPLAESVPGAGDGDGEMPAIPDIGAVDIEAPAPQPLPQDGVSHATPDPGDDSPGGWVEEAAQAVPDHSAAARASASLAGRDTTLTRDTDLEEAGISRLREAASVAARRDAEAGVPSLDGDGTSESENDLRDRCRAFFDRWCSAERRQLESLLAQKEQDVADKLGRGSLSLDRFERMTNELIRLKARLTRRRDEVANQLQTDDDGPTRGLSTRVYAAAIGFLGVVEFFANAPVFSALLPRDPLTERQIRLVAETSEGWLAGAERVFAHLILRPDAALLAAGVVTFLCVLAHFFGHSLRAAVMQKDQAERYHVAGRSQIENVIPMILSGLGLLLVLGVLYEARVTLGEVGEQQYQADMAVVTEMRRQSGFLRADGELLQANQLTNQAGDMEAAATALLEYARAMSRLSFPILLLNSTLVLCAISAAYFHRSDRRREHFNETPFERQRMGLIEAAESTAEEVARYLSDVTRDIRELKTLSATSLADERRSVSRQLESVIALYRAENGRTRSVDPRSIPAFRDTIDLGLEAFPDTGDSLQPLRSAREYDDERKSLQLRFDGVRKRFNEEALAW
jgi:hypothetical protein